MERGLRPNPFAKVGCAWRERHRLTYVFVAPLDRCESLGVLANGTKSTNESTPGTTVRFWCNSGFVLLGTTNLTCRLNGTWSGSKPLCEGMNKLAV